MPADNDDRGVERPSGLSAEGTISSTLGHPLNHEEGKLHVLDVAAMPYVGQQPSVVLSCAVDFWL
jgi:hypothetical protein